MNWRLKILAKILLSRLPFDYRTFRGMGIFRHGHMREANYACGVVTTHLDRMVGRERVKDAVCLELGPGDSLASAIITNALGARKTYLVDAGDYAARDLDVYREIARWLREQGIPAIDQSQVDTIDAMLYRLGATYLTDGLASLRTIESSSVDLIWSQAVLEHIRLKDIDATFAELRRICSSTGKMSHRIDFMDHLGGALNNLRFSEKVWESDFMARSGFYTNRVRSTQMQRAMHDAGFELTIVSTGKWDHLPVPRAHMAQPYRDLPEVDLLTSWIDVLADPSGPSE
jgi:hypothetical protein